MAAPENAEPFNALLVRWRAGDDAARDAVIALIHSEVSTIASMILRRHNAPRSVVTEDLVNEAFLKIIQQTDISVESRAHLLALCARIMKFILVDNVRRRSSVKRNGEIVTLADTLGAEGEFDVDAQALAEALLRLQAIAPERARIVEMRYFGGMTMEDIAVVTGVSEATVKRSWRVTRAWLKEAIENGVGNG